MDKHIKPLNLLKPLPKCDCKADWCYINDDVIVFTKNAIFKIKEEEMSPYVTGSGAGGNQLSNLKEPPEVKEINVDIDIEIKDGHILAELGCKKHICHNLQELMVVAKKELLKEMPILKDFGKAEKKSTHRVVKKKASNTDKG